jgi:hypothetical protein
VDWKEQQVVLVDSVVMSGTAKNKKHEKILILHRAIMCSKISVLGLRPSKEMLSPLPVAWEIVHCILVLYTTDHHGPGLGTHSYAEKKNVNITKSKGLKYF